MGSAQGPTKAASGGSKWLKTGLFAGGIAVVLGVATALSMLDRPPKMPANDDHVVLEKMPNKTCIGCHAPGDLPDSHPLDYEKYACPRCHEQTQVIDPLELQKRREQAQQGGEAQGPIADQPQSPPAAAEAQPEAAASAQAIHAAPASGSAEHAEPAPQAAP